MVQDDCKIWKRKPASQKTSTQFEIEFAIANAEIFGYPQTTNSAGLKAYNAAEFQRDKVSAFNNLANAT